MSDPSPPPSNPGAPASSGEHTLIPPDPSTSPPAARLDQATAPEGDASGALSEHAAAPQAASSDVGRTVEADLAAAYRELQNLLVERTNVTDFMQQVAALAASVVPGVSCGITMRRDHEVATIAVSDDLAAAIDEIQYGHGQGPCLETMHTGTAIGVADLAADDRWGDYRIHALTYGVRSSLSIPLKVNDTLVGALNLYATVANSFGIVETARCEAFAYQAAAALSIVLRNADQAVLEQQLREALATRAIIDQALGIIMGQRRIDAREAFAVLRLTSR